MEQFTSDNLLFHSFPVQTEDITIQSGLNLKRAAVLGKVTADAGSAPSVVGTGNGTMLTPSAQRNSKTGDYIVECVEVITHGGRFQ